MSKEPAYANNQDPDQIVHVQSLVSVFAVRIHTSWTLFILPSEQH